MANPLGALGSIPIMDVIQSTLQRSANIRNQQILGDERQQMMQMRAQEMQERQATMKALQQDLQGGLQAQIDKSTIPSEDDSPIAAAQKNVRMLQQQMQQANARAASIAGAGGSVEAAQFYQRQAMDTQAKLTSAMRELRLEQHNQARQMGESAGAATPENFPQVMADLKAQDPRIDRKYPWDRDVDGNPVWGDTTKRTLNTIAQSSMTAKEQLDMQLKAHKAQEDDQERQLRMEREKVQRKKIAAEAAVAQVNADRAAKGQPLLGREGERERTGGVTGANKSVDRLQALADREPTKSAVDSARAAIRNEFKGEFDDSLDTFARSVAAKTNEIRAKTARNGEEMDLDEARSEALDTLKPFVKETTKGGTDLPFLGHVGGSKMLSFRRAGMPVAAPAEKPLPMPQTKNDLVKGKVYNTARGSATWDGEKFTLVQ